MQPTQRPTVASQAGRLVPAHFVRLVAEHWPQAPLGSQAGVALGHWLSLEHAWQA